MLHLPPSVLLKELSVGGLLGLVRRHAPLDEALLVGFELLLLLRSGLLWELLLDLLRCLRGLTTASLLLLLLLLCGSSLLLLGSIWLASILVLGIRGHPLLILHHRRRHLLLRPSCLVLLRLHVLRLLARHHLSRVGV